MTNVSLSARATNPTARNSLNNERLRPTIAPTFGTGLEPDVSESSETLVVDTNDLAINKAPLSDLELEVANAPLPAAQIVGGYVISAEYMRRIMVYARRERLHRLGAKHP
jgi:hypothetical protein